MLSMALTASPFLIHVKPIAKGKYGAAAKH
jgi:hypothetical protein